MNPLIAGNLKSKTSWTSTALIVLGALQQAFPAFVDAIPDRYEGTALSVIGAVMLILRNATTQSIAAKGGGS